MNYDRNQIIDLLNRLPDPEIPVVNIVEMGIVREVELRDNEVNVVITPTYSGCPAMREIRNDIEQLLRSAGFYNVNISTSFSPPWTTELLSRETKEKLKNYGIAPPGELTSKVLFDFMSKSKLVSCPYCDSENTEMRSEFGSTPCKALYYCHDCMQPFEHFKCI